MHERSIYGATLVALHGAVVVALCGASAGCAPGVDNEEADLAEPDPGPSAVAVLTNETWSSPYRGGRGREGIPFTSTCAPGSIAVGIHGNGSDRIDRLGLVCRHLERNGTLGREDIGTTAGGDGGRPFDSRCPDGYAISGLMGRSADRLDRLQIVCNTLPGTIEFHGNPVGGSGGRSWADVPPPRHFMTEIVGRSGEAVDGIYAVYNRLHP